MALTAEQQKAIDAVLTDPMIRTAVKVALDAEKQSKVLDASGVQRKGVDQVPNLPTVIATESVAEQTKQTGATFSLEGLTAETAAIIKARLDEIVKASDESGKCPKCGGAMKDGKCEKCGYEAAKKSLSEPETQPKPAEQVLPSVKATPPTGEQKKGLQPPGVAKVQLGQTRPLLTSDIADMYEAITEIIEARVSKAVADTKTAIYAEVSKALQERDQFLADHAKQFEELEILKEAVLVQKAYDDMVEVLNQHSEALAEVQVGQEKIETMSKQLIETNVTPRISTIFKGLAASDSDATVISDNSALAKAHPAESASGVLATKYGLKPSRSNGAG